MYGEWTEWLKFTVCTALCVNTVQGRLNVDGGVLLRLSVNFNIKKLWKIHQISQRQDQLGSSDQLETVTV